MTALFADIVGSTALGEFLEIEEVKALVGECTTRIAEVIERYGGVVGSFMGDGIAAFFGLEAAREDDPLRAASAALEVRNVVAQYALEVQAAWGVENLNVRIGVNCGRVATGPVGGSVKQVQALGDAVNVAARLQALADPGSIVIGSRVARAVASEFDVKPIGTVAVKGRTKKVEAFSLLASERLDVSTPRHPILGRVDEIGRFEAILDDLLLGRGQIVLVLGEPGIGKSRLVEEAKERAGSEVLWLDARVSSLRSPLPYEAFVEVLRGWLGLERDIPDVAVRVRLQAKLSFLLGERGEELVPALSRMLGLQPRTKADHALDGLPVDVRRRGLHGAFLEWATAVARRNPLVLTIDNCERLDEASTQLAVELLSTTDVAPLLIAICARPDEAREIRIRALTEFGHRCLELRLGPLTDEAAHALVIRRDADGIIGPGVAETLVDRSEGNPLYLHELFNAVIGAELTLTNDISLPPALEAVLLARLDRLPRVAKELAQAAAVLGREFSRDTLRLMTQSAEVDEGLRLLLRADVIREHRREPRIYTFKHGLVREAALATLTRRRLRRLHARAAAALEETVGPEPRDSIAALTAHVLASGDEEKAVALMEQLVERYASVFRLDEAIGVLESSLNLVPSASVSVRRRLTRRLAQLRGEFGDAEGAVRVIDELEHQQLASEERIDLEILKGELLTNAGILSDAEVVLKHCLDRSAAGSMRDRVRAQLAALYLRKQELAEARSLIEPLDDADALPADVGLQVASVWAGYLAATGDFVSARAWGAKALALAGVIGRTSIELRASRQLGVIQVLNGRLSDGFRLLKQSFDRSRDLGYTVGMLESGVNLVHGAYLLGDLDVAEEVSRSLLELNDAPFFEAHVKTNLASVLFERDDLRNAEAVALRVLSLGMHVTSPAPQIGARALIAKIRAAAQEWEVAERELAQARQIVEQIDGRGGLMGSVRTELAELALASGDTQRALLEAEAGLEDMEFVEKPMQVPLLRVKGCAIAASDADAGLSILNDVRNMSRVMEMRLEEARTLVAIGRCSTEPDRSFDEAADLFDACGSKRGLVELADARTQLIGS